MPAYRLYHIDGAGRFHRSEVIEADCDEQAVELSSALLSGLAGELWLAERLISQLGKTTAGQERGSRRAVQWNRSAGFRQEQ